MRTKKIKFLSLFVLLFFLSSCGSKATERARQEREVLKVGMTVGYPPFNWTQKNAQEHGVKVDGSIEYADGYDVVMAQKVAKGMGKELMIVKTEWDGLVPALLSGKIDAVMAGMSPNPERNKVVNFTDSYYNAELVMVVLADGDYQGSTAIQDFSGAKVTGQLNTFHYQVLDQIDGIIKEVPVDTSSSMRVALRSNVIDAYISDLPEGLSAELAIPEFKLIEFTEGFEVSDADTIIAIGLNKDNPDLEKFNQVLRGISENERAEIMRQAVARQPALSLTK